MIRRESNQASLADALVRRAGSTISTFDRIDLTIDWSSAGLYMVKMHAENFTDVQKLTLVK